MQYKNDIYDPSIHDIYNTLCVKQPYANYIATGEKTIEVRSRNTTFRGDVLICSSSRPRIEGLQSGATMCLVEIYDVKRVEDFTEEDWQQTCIVGEDREEIIEGYGWLLRNPRRVVELPVKGQLGIFKMVFDKGDIIEYPQNVIIDDDAWLKIEKL